MQKILSKIELIESTSDSKTESCELIKNFWKEHNNINQSDEDARLDYDDWTNEGHKFFLINEKTNLIGFAHIGSRGAAIDRLEDLFVILKNIKEKELLVLL